MVIKWYGTASISIETENSAVLFDPYIPMKGSKTPSAEREYLSFDNIVITHGHVDHIGTLHRTVGESGAVIYCTATPFETLKKRGVSEQQLRKIAPGDTLTFGDIRLTVYQSRHVQFDKALIKKTVFSPRILKYFGNLVRLGIDAGQCQENGETVGYLIEAEGKRVFVMASMNWVEGAEYPTDCDLLVLPYQGCSDLLTPAMKFIEMTRPKAVFLDHFDDTFPPLSDSIDYSDIVAALDGRLPLTVPEFEKEYSV